MSPFDEINTISKVEMTVLSKEFNYQNLKESFSTGDKPNKSYEFNIFYPKNIFDEKVNDEIFLFTDSKIFIISVDKEDEKK